MSLDGKEQKDWPERGTDLSGAKVNYSFPGKGVGNLSSPALALSKSVSRKCPSALPCGQPVLGALATLADILRTGVTLKGLVHGTLDTKRQHPKGYWDSKGHGAQEPGPPKHIAGMAEPFPWPLFLPAQCSHTPPWPRSCFHPRLPCWVLSLAPGPSGSHSAHHAVLQSLPPALLPGLPLLPPH